jgi:hypothetical protein
LGLLSNVEACAACADAAAYEHESWRWRIRSAWSVFSSFSRFVVLTPTCLPDSIIARDIIFKNKMSYLREKLTADTRFRLPMSEYEQWLEANEVPRAEGIEFLKALHTAGLVLYYPHRAPNFIFLRPRAVTRELLNLLDPDGSIASALMQNKTANLAKLEAEYAELSRQKAVLDETAMRRGNRWVKIMMGSVVVQAAVMTRLIWWDLSWDVMEPIAYLLGFSYLTFGWGWCRAPTLPSTAPLPGDSSAPPSRSCTPSLASRSQNTKKWERRLSAKRRCSSRLAWCGPRIAATRIPFPSRSRRT